MEILGVDIGGSQIKAAPVDGASGRISDTPRRLDTPKQSTPVDLAAAIVTLAEHFAWTGPIGCTFPGPIVDSEVMDAGHLDASWLGKDAQALLSEHTSRTVTVLNDADAAGIAEMRFGAARGLCGTVLVLTFGTGIGSALFRQGHLIPNTELGTLFLESGAAEKFASARIRSHDNLTYAEWAARVSRFVNHVDSLLYPELIVIGGAISSSWNEFADQLDVRANVVPAALTGDAGIVGAAIVAGDSMVSTSTTSQVI